MSKVFEALKKALSLGAVEQDNQPQKPTGSKITNQVLLHELVAHFEDRIEELSVGKRLLYPMSFNILMHPDDYNRTKESLPFVLPEVVAAFYGVIRRKAKDYSAGVNYAPPATYWFFQFSACQIGTNVEGKEDFIKQGEIVTTGSLTTFDIFRAQRGNMRTEANVHLSVKCQNSNTNDNNINMDALLGMEILSEGSYTFPFDKSLNEDSSRISMKSEAERKGWAELRWAAANGGYNVYEMMDTYIDISGSAETRQTRNILRIESDAVSVSHVQIKYDQATQTFSLAAYAKTRLNSREVPLSSGGAPQWIMLPKKNSKIFLNDTVSVEFNANPDLV
ncbi:MAG: hypothetical protein IK073_05910 [Paludibacteraceae bacterium]|nr:hypothetical protein [Paludibacteraceae bacterium]